MRSIRFTQTRAEKTRDAQTGLAAAPPNGQSWVWPKKTVVQWDDDCTALEQLIIAEIDKRTDMRNAAILFQSDTDGILRITRNVKALGAVHFENNPDARKLFTDLKTAARGRKDIYEQGEEAHQSWMDADPAWVMDDPNLTSAASFGSLLGSFLARKRAHGIKVRAWRVAASMLMNKAQQVDRDNINWYTAATRKFLAGTAPGDMIRSLVPTTARPENPVGQAVISHLMVAGTDIHFDFTAPHATRYTVLHQAPGSPVFLVVLAETNETSFTLHNAAAGLHRFKVEPMNSRGEGPESAVVEATVAAQAAA